MDKLELDIVHSLKFMEKCPKANEITQKTLRKTKKHEDHKSTQQQPDQKAPARADHSEAQNLNLGLCNECRNRKNPDVVEVPPDRNCSNQQKVQGYISGRSLLPRIWEESTRSHLFP